MADPTAPSSPHGDIELTSEQREALQRFVALAQHTRAALPSAGAPLPEDFERLLSKLGPQRHSR